MNYLVVGDLHLKLCNLDAAQLVFDELETLSSKLGTYDTVKPGIHFIFLGDIYETKSIIRTEVQNFFVSKLAKLLEKEGASATIIVGNHDYTNLNLVEHAFGFWSTLTSFDPKIRIVDIPIIDNASKMAFAPFMTDNAKFTEFAKSVPSDHILFCHQAINGFQFNTCDNMKETNGVNQSDIPCKVVAGHFHSFQHNGNVLYLGTPFAHSFGEANQSKHLLLIDAKRKLTILPTSACIPKYLTFDITLNQLINVSQDTQFDLRYTKQDFVKFIIKDKEENCQKVTKEFLGSLMEQGKLPVCDNIFKKEVITDTVMDVKIDENQSIVSMFEEYINLYMNDHPDKGFIIKLGKERYLNNATL